jgi:hypothetical protein
MGMFDPFEEPLDVVYLLAEPTQQIKSACDEPNRFHLSDAASGSGIHRAS